MMDAPAIQFAKEWCKTSNPRPCNFWTEKNVAGVLVGCSNFSITITPEEIADNRLDVIERKMEDLKRAANK